MLQNDFLNKLISEMDLTIDEQRFINGLKEDTNRIEIHANTELITYVINNYKTKERILNKIARCDDLTIDIDLTKPATKLNLDRYYDKYRDRIAEAVRKDIELNTDSLPEDYDLHYMPPQNLIFISTLIKKIYNYFTE